MDLINRTKLKSELSEWKDALEQIFGGEYSGVEIVNMAIRKVDDQPSAEQEYRLDEFCEDCKEYDHDKHCCPRFNRVIRQTLNEAQTERNNAVWEALSKVYNMKGLPDEAYSIIGDLMLSLDGGGA